jgi:hypothetical protein
MSFRMVNRFVLVAAVAAVTFVVVGNILRDPSHATSAVDTPSAGAVIADEEVSSAAADRGVSAATAREQLQDERQLPLLERRARLALGDNYGGVWVDDKGHIKLAVVSARDAIPTGLASEAQQAITAASLNDRVSLVATPNSEDKLSSIQAEIDKLLTKANQGAASSIDVESDIIASSVRLNVPLSLTQKQRRLLKRLREHYEDMLVVVEKRHSLTVQPAPRSNRH